MLKFLLVGILTLASILPGCLIYGRWLGRFYERKTSTREDIITLFLVLGLLLLGSVFIGIFVNWVI